MSKLRTRPNTARAKCALVELLGMFNDGSPGHNLVLKALDALGQPIEQIHAEDIVNGFDDLTLP